jgi:hypothetical protein
MRVYEYTNTYNTINNYQIRPLNSTERKAISIIENFIKTFHVELYNIYRNALYMTGKKSGALGQYETRLYNDGIQHVFLSLEIFTMPFTHAAGLVLHEWSHIFGGDGSEYFTYALTDIIILILSDKNITAKIIQYEKEWKLITAEIIEKNKLKENKINNAYWQRIKVVKK